MDLNSEISKEALIDLYNEKKPYIVPIVAILVSIFLFLSFIFPQALALPQKKGAFDKEVDNINNLREYEKAVKSARVDLIDSQMQSVSEVLPLEKDFASILYAIISAANNTSTPIEDYRFEEDVATPGEATVKFPAIKFSLNISGDPYQSVAFIRELYRTAPISEVVEINTKANITTISIVFYYKPFAPVSFAERTSVKQLSQAQNKLLDDLSEWNRPVEPEFELSEEESSGSAEILP